MVLIFSNDHDPTTNLVIEWLISFGVEYRRINSEDLTKPRIPLHGDPEEGRISIPGMRCLDSEHSPIRVCWYRRWNRSRTPQGKERDPFVRKLRWEANKEVVSISRFLFHRFKDLPWLTDPARVEEEEKVLTLKVAKQQGLKIPKSIICNRREQVLRSFPEEKEVIAKPLNDPSGSFDQEEEYPRIFAEPLDRRSIQALPEHFFPSFFQERIEKSHEIRAFFLDGTFYPTALFLPSVNSGDIKIENGMEREMARIDRTVLPRTVEKKLTGLMNELGLNTGSIDLLVRPDGEHVFLEVNTIGQFIGYAEQANHAFDRRIAQWLIQKDQDYENEERFVR